MTNDLYYDPWDVDIDIDPYPTYQRLRDESPLYYNERHDFWGISRYLPTSRRRCKDPHFWLSSAKGDILEVVKADPVMPPVVFINEDPPLHTNPPGIGVQGIHAKEDAGALEDKVRAFCFGLPRPLGWRERASTSSSI